MARGAKSIRGALGTYAWTSTGATALLALVLWLGPCSGPPPITVTLAADGPWAEGTLDDGVRLWELFPGQAVEVPPGSYRVTLFGPEGLAQRQSLVLTTLPVTLGHEPEPDAEPLNDDPDASR